MDRAQEIARFIHKFLTAHGVEVRTDDPGLLTAELPASLGKNSESAATCGSHVYLLRPTPRRRSIPGSSSPSGIHCSIGCWRWRSPGDRRRASF